MTSAYSAKMETSLYASVSATMPELEASPDLRTGFDSENKSWEVIIQYSGSPQELLEAFPTITLTPLMGNYAIAKVARELIQPLALSPYVIYMEKPRQLFYELINSRASTCLGGIINELDLTGRDTIVGVIDSGIDYFHPDFRNPDGTTRILNLWDQTLGEIYSSDDINNALSAPSPQEALEICPSQDFSGHGTHVTGIAAGNGRASMGQYRGIAYEANLIIVKLATGNRGLTTTARLMEAIDFCIRKSMDYSMPLALNLSYGNTYGSHSGSSLLERYIDYVSSIYKLNIVVGSGNEADTGGHALGRLDNESAVQNTELAISNYSTNLTIQIWKKPWDDIVFSLVLPSGSQITIPDYAGLYRFTARENNIYITVGESTPYSIYQEIYIDLSGSPYLTSGIWTIAAKGQDIIDGTYDMWLPSYVARNQDTRFLIPQVLTTLTIPSTADRVITVGAYDSTLDRPVSFSGRGPTWSTTRIKPELAAPGVNIMSCAPGGSYSSKTGTSMATPFVTGSCALLMQWGIVDGNDPFFYGDKIKAALIRGSKRLPFDNSYPNPVTGWGTLCLRDSLPN